MNENQPRYSLLLQFMPCVQVKFYSTIKTSSLILKLSFITYIIKFMHATDWFCRYAPLIMYIKGNLHQSKDWFLEQKINTDYKSKINS